MATTLWGDEDADAVFELEPPDAHEWSPYSVSVRTLGAIELKQLGDRAAIIELQADLPADGWPRWCETAEDKIAVLRVLEEVIYRVASGWTVSRNGEVVQDGALMVEHRQW